MLYKMESIQNLDGTSPDFSSHGDIGCLVGGGGSSIDHNWKDNMDDRGSISGDSCVPFSNVLSNDQIAEVNQE